MTIYALDCEFADDGKVIDLISIGMVCEDGRTFYRQNRDADWVNVNPWVREHVFPGLECFSLRHEVPSRHTDLTPVTHRVACPWLFYREIGAALRAFVDKAPVSAWWGYYSSYDFVALCQLFGPMVVMPPAWPRYCHDLKQWSAEHRHVRFEKPTASRHHALDDAQWVMETYQRYVRMNRD